MEDKLWKDRCVLLNKGEENELVRVGDCAGFWFHCAPLFPHARFEYAAASSSPSFPIQALSLQHSLVKEKPWLSSY